MILGEIPGLALDRTGVALLGAIILLATERIAPAAAWEAIDVPTIGLLFGLMIVSAQFRLGGAYTWITRRIAEDAELSPPALLALLIAVSAGLSAVLCNDIVCLAMAPILVEACARRRLAPLPFLLALACASNIGSAATLIGNPQNMLIGQRLQLSFAGYMAVAVVPSALGLVVLWWVIWRQTGGRWQQVLPPTEVSAAPFNPWQTGKGALVVAVLMAAFLFTGWPREVVALAAAGLLLASRQMASREILGLVDWQLLVLFAGLFVVNHVLAEAGALAWLFQQAGRLGLDPHRLPDMFALSVVLSNLVSNVPATMLLLPAAEHPLAGAVLALSSTLAGNLLVVGSIANIIVIDQADRLGVRISWRDHARVGVPVTLLTLLIAAGWLAAWARLTPGG